MTEIKAVNHIWCIALLWRVERRQEIKIINNILAVGFCDTITHMPRR